jgi:hypothetical protein
MRRALAMVALANAALAIVALAAACGPPAPPRGHAVPATYFTAARTDTTFRVADHMQASIEMQISGEPFAALLGRNLAGFDRFAKLTDQYTDPDTGETVTDPLGYIAAIETYEYSKQPMNNLSFEAGAGLALEFGPLLNAANVSGDPGVQLLLDRLQHFADLSHAGGPPMKAFVVSPAPVNNPRNIYGWPGYFPVFAEFDSFRPDIAPTNGAARGCNFVGGYLAQAQGVQVVGDYECGYNSLNLPAREQQVDKVLDPAALGFALWKQALWVINYWQSAHDLLGNPIIQVADADLPLVGEPGNTVVGQFPDPNDPTGATLVDGVAGTYLGDITLEGWQGLTMLDEMDNKAALLLGRLLTGDGVQLGGFATVADAFAYDGAAPRWWPAATAVTEASPTQPLVGNAWREFPQPTAFQIASGKSTLRGLCALVGGYATAYALSDAKNPDIGAQLGPRATFDGDPFAADDGAADGEETFHDRALAIVRVGVIALEKLHFDAAHAVLVDEAALGGDPAARGARVSTFDAAYAIVSLRAARRALQSTLALYSNDTPDTAGLADPLALSDRITTLIVAEADFLADKLAAGGAVSNFMDVGSGAADAAPTRVEAEAAAIRGLLEAYLATSNERYRQAAQRVYADLESRFWMDDVRAFRTTAGESQTLTYTPLAVGALSGALRQYWKLVARRPGSERVASDLLERWKRLNKLVVNGWDDADADDRVTWPDECTGAGLQMGERALTGELSHVADGADRDHDCVPEISVAKLPAALAAEVRLTVAHK